MKGKSCLFLMMLMVCLGLCACGKDVSNTRFLGSWTGELDYGNSAVNLLSGIVSSVTGKDVANGVITFNPDGTCKFYIMDTKVGEGTFTIDKKDTEAYVTITSDDGTTENMTFTYNESYITSENGKSWFKEE